MSRLVELSSTTSTGRSRSSAGCMTGSRLGLGPDSMQMRGEMEGAALARLALHPDPAAHLLHQTRAMDKPSPVPPNCRVVEPSACVNASKIIACLSGGDADARVADARSATAAGRRPDTPAPPAAPLRPAGVNLIALPTRLKHLAQAAGVTHEASRAPPRATSHGQLHAFLRRAQGKRLHRLVQAVAQTRTGLVQDQLARLRSSRSPGCR